MWLAQRRVRVLNPATREAYTAGEYERRLLNLPDDAPSPTLYRPGPRDPSGGYRGRTGIYELVLIDEHMRAMIHDGSGEHELERYARTLTPSIRDDGRTKVLAGMTRRIDGELIAGSVLDPASLAETKAVLA